MRLRPGSRAAHGAAFREGNWRAPIAAAVCTALAMCVAHAGVSSAPPAPERAIPMRPGLFTLEQPAAPMELTGYALAQEGAPVTGVPPALRPGVPLEITLHWRLVHPLPEDLRIVLRLQGSGPAFTESYAAAPLRAGEIGGVYPREYALPLPRHRYAGEATLTVDLESASLAPPARLAAVPVRLLAEAVPSTLEDAAIAERFGAGALRAGKALRLGRGGEAVIALPASVESWRAIGIVSYLDHDPRLRHGTAIAVIQPMRDGTPSGPALTLRAGVHTGLVDPAPGPRLLRALRGARVFDRRPGPEGDARSLHRYAAALSLGEDSSAGALLIRYAAPTGILAIEEIAILDGAAR